MSSDIGHKQPGSTLGSTEEATEWAEVEISFSNKPLRSLCEDPSSGYPGDAADALRDRLADVRAADSAMDLVLVAELIADPPPPRIVIDLSEGQAILCQVAHANVPMSGSAVAWEYVRRVKIMHVGGRA